MWGVFRGNAANPSLSSRKQDPVCKAAIVKWNGCGPCVTTTDKDYCYEHCYNGCEACCDGDK